MKTLVLFLSVFFVHIVVWGENTDIITPKMKFAVAAELLKLHQAELTVIQIAYPNEKTNHRLEHFILVNGRTIELSLIRKNRDSDWTIDAIFEVVWVSSGENREKQWISLNELRLEEPKQAPNPSASATPSGPMAHR